MKPCPHCGKQGDGQWVDEGIGSYEFWGQKCNDTAMSFRCEYCNEELESGQTYEEYVYEMRYRDND